MQYSIIVVILVQSREVDEILLNEQVSTGVLQEFLKHAIPDYLVRGTDLFSLRLSN